VFKMRICCAIDSIRRFLCMSERCCICWWSDASSCGTMHGLQCGHQLRASAVVSIIKPTHGWQSHWPLAVHVAVRVIGQHVVIKRGHQLRVHVAAVPGLNELGHDVIECQFFIGVAGQEAQHQACQAVGVWAVGHLRASIGEAPRNCIPPTTGNGQHADARAC
jgi:hypothetical protein